MSSGPAPSVTTTKFYLLTAGSGANERIIVDGLDNSFTSVDFDDGNGDNLNFFGDIPNDLIDYNGSNQVAYVGKTANPNEFVVRQNGNDYLFTNNTYFQGDTISFAADPYAVCYAAGTHILTEHGNEVVEALAIGDLVVTASGEYRPIKWIGHRKMPCRGRANVLPVRITAHAFGEGRPARDLFVSPAHAIAVDVLGGVLIPAIRLVNGTTITQVEADTVSYWHVELDSHDILLAEGLPAESYLDCGNRRFFANADATDLLAPPDARPEGPLQFCRPFYEADPVVDLVRARLQDRAVMLGWQRVEETFAGLHVVADGRVVHPDVDGLTARFVIPADAKNVRLVSATSVPAHVLPGTSDDRELGVSLASLVIDDGLTGARSVALDDARLTEGFHPVDRDGDASWRWTTGEAVLPASLWDGCVGTLFLRVQLSGPALPRWVSPSETAGVVDLGTFRHQA